MSDRPIPTRTRVKKTAGDAASDANTAEARDLTQMGPSDPNDGLSPQERAELAAEEQRARAEEGRRARGLEYAPDPGLIEVASPGQHVDHVVTEYVGPSGDIEMRLASARRAALGATIDTELREIDPLAAWQPPRPAAPIDPEAPAMGVVSFGDTGSRRRGSDADGLIEGGDEIDTLVGSNRWRANAMFEHLRDRKLGHKFAFRRHYYAIGVLLDTFPDQSERVILELSERADAIERYNASCSRPEERLGYIAHVLGQLPSPEQCAKARQREIVTAMQRTLVPGTQMPVGEIVAQPPPGAARIGQKSLALPGGTSMDAAYFHDAMLGIYTVVSASGVRTSANNLQLAEQKLREALTPAPEAATV